MRTARRSSFTMWVALAALGAAGSACGGDDDDDRNSADASPGGGAGTALDELGAAMAETLCPRLFDCCSDGDLRQLFEEDVSPEVPTDVPGCVAAVTASLEEIAGGMADSVAAGRMQYSGERMEACLEAIGEHSCDRFAATVADLTGFPECEPPFTPLVADGAACATSEECTSGFCSGSGDGKLGACAALPAEGDPCPDSSCADGLYCDDIGATCLPQKADGEECGASTQCAGGDCRDGMCGSSPLCDGQG